MPTPSYAGAVQAVKDYLAANFTAIPVGYLNGEAPASNDSSGNPTAWALIEIRGTSAEPRSIALKGQKLWTQFFMLWAHVFTPNGSGDSAAREYAEQIGNVFREALFYDSEALHCVRTNTPNVHDGDSGSDDGLWYRVSVSVDGEYWYQA